METNKEGNNEPNDTRELFEPLNTYIMAATKLALRKGISPPILICGYLAATVGNGCIITSQVYRERSACSEEGRKQFSDAHLLGAFEAFASSLAEHGGMNCATSRCDSKKSITIELSPKP